MIEEESWQQTEQEMGFHALDLHNRPEQAEAFFNRLMEIKKEKLSDKVDEWFLSESLKNKAG